MIGELVSRGPRYFCWKPAGPNWLNVAELPASSAAASAGQTSTAEATEDRVDRLDHRVVVALGVRNGAGAGIGRDQQQRNTDAARQRQAIRAVGQDLRRHVIVEAVGLVVGDDDRALAPQTSGCWRSR